VESFAGTGNPFSMGQLRPGETVLDIGCGAGFDTIIAARQVGATGRVVAVDMTPAMLEKAAAGAREAGLANVEFRQGLAEALPVDDGSIDVVISNGVINLCPDKTAVMQEVYCALKPGGRIQIADIVVHKELPQDAKDDIDLWSG
jgi:ubiquinone/menaquinone biosynthesis C-methylase UbiE